MDLLNKKVHILQVCDINIFFFKLQLVQFGRTLVNNSLLNFNNTCNFHSFNEKKYIINNYLLIKAKLTEGLQNNTQNYIMNWFLMQTCHTYQRFTW